MKKKALLVGAQASFSGPWVNLEQGQWLVEPGSDQVELVVEAEQVMSVFNGGKEVFLAGPCRIRAEVSADYEGERIHLDVRQLSRGARDV